MNYLITGSSGFIGSHLTKKIRETGNTVYSMNRDFSLNLDGSRAEDNNLKNGYKTPINVVIHCAASHPSQVSNERDLFSGNVVFTKQLLDRISNRRPKVLIFLSTISVYGDPRPGPLHLCSPMINPSEYGRAKKQTEDLVQSWGTIKNVATHCIRLPAVMGEHEHHTFLPRLIQALRLGNSIKTHALTSLFNHIVHVDDVCRFLIKLSEKNKFSSITQLAASKPLKLETVVNKICDYYNISETYICPGPTETSYVDISDAKKLGFQPMPTENLLYRKFNANRLLRS